jgi:hypothetical protein
MKFDIETFREQARAGMEGAYLMFQDEDNNVLGYLGPFHGGTDAARAHMRGITNAENLAVEAVDHDSPWAMYPYFWHHVSVVELTPHEIECLANPEKETDDVNE